MDNLLVYKILHALGHANAKEEETRRIKQLAAGALCDKIGLQTPTEREREREKRDNCCYCPSSGVVGIKLTIVCNIEKRFPVRYINAMHL